MMPLKSFGFIAKSPCTHSGVFVQTFAEKVCRG